MICLCWREVKFSDAFRCKFIKYCACSSVTSWSFLVQMFVIKLQSSVKIPETQWEVVSVWTWDVMLRNACQPSWIHCCWTSLYVQLRIFVFNVSSMNANIPGLIEGSWKWSPKKNNWNSSLTFSCVSSFVKSGLGIFVHVSKSLSIKQVAFINNQQNKFVHSGNETFFGGRTQLW